VNYELHFMEATSHLFGWMTSA